MEQLEMFPKENVNRGNERFKRKEPIVLIPIFCLSLLRGICQSVQDRKLLGLDFPSRRSFWITSHFATWPGIMLVAFMTEIHGRKPIFILLFSISLLCSILSYVPYQQPWIMTGIVLLATLNGGAAIINPLSICEYCSPKHRLAWFAANDFVFYAITHLTRSNLDFIGISYLLYAPALEALIALGGLVSIYWWPESPYSLLKQGLKEESRAALLTLRGEGEAAHEELHALETARRHPSPKVFWFSLLIAILANTVIVSCSSLTFALMEISHSHDVGIVSHMHVVDWCKIGGTLIISLLIVLISYIVKRKVVYLSTAVIPLVLVYIITVWAYVVGDNDYAISITSVICEILLHGLMQLSLLFYVEAIPQKYYTYISCVSMMYLNVASSIFGFFIVPNLDILIILLVYSSLALVAVLLIYWLALETRDKHLLKIEKSYMTRLFYENPVQNTTSRTNTNS